MSACVWFVDVSVKVWGSALSGVVEEQVGVWPHWCDSIRSAQTGRRVLSVSSRVQISFDSTSPRGVLLSPRHQHDMI